MASRFPSRSNATLTSREEHLRQINEWAPVLLAAVFAIAGVYGVGVAIPALYDSHAWRRGMQVLACLSFAELLSHWWLTRFTDASYTRLETCLEVKVTSRDFKDAPVCPRPWGALASS
ncbi:hypothetical protein EGW08_014744, partial [Elysia chlorotica]